MSKRGQSGVTNRSDATNTGASTSAAATAASSSTASASGGAGTGGAGNGTAANDETNQAASGKNQIPFIALGQTKLIVCLSTAHCV